MELKREEVDSNRTIRLAIFGGARHQEERTWTDASTVHTVELAADDDDVSITSVEKSTVTGAELAPLSSAATVTDSQRKILIFGGLNIIYMETTN